LCCFAQSSIYAEAKSLPANGQYPSNSQSAQVPKKGFKISGKVVDSNNEPLIGVNIQCLESKTGDISDLNGHFTLTVPSEQSSLFVSYIGMKSQTIKVNGKASFKITMFEDAKALSEAVVVGAYGTAHKRSDLVGSSFQINSDKLQTLPKARVDQMLEGLVPGLIVEPNSDSPDNARPRYNVRVRGDASLAASNEPLWIVDGTPMYTGESTNQVPGMSYSISPLSFINPEDIEFITVLKDATSTSIYGANGANGVILITTKKGLDGATKVNLALKYGIAHIDESTKPKVLKSKDFLILAKEAWTNAGKDASLFPFTDNPNNSYSTTDTDWYKTFYGIGRTTDINLSLSGGNKDSRHFISGSYFNSKPTIIGNTQSRYSVRANAEMSFLEKFKFVFNLNSSYNVNDVFNPGKDYYEFMPIISPLNEDGTYRQYYQVLDGKDESGNNQWAQYRFWNSVAEREENIYNQKTFFTNSNIQINYEIAKGLSYNGQFGVDYQNAKEEQYDASTNWSGKDSNGYSSRSSLSMMNWTTTHRINFDRSFGKHRVSGIAGFEASSKDYTTITAYGSGFINDKIQDVSYAEERHGNNYSSTSRKASFLAQASYAYDNRYYLTLNFRKDGNSQFGSDVRWGNFGSAGVSWNIQNEKFFNIQWINILKLKASYGSNGNSRLGSQEATGLYSYGDSYNYAGHSGGVMTGAPNPGLSWETTYMTNLGLRIETFDRFDLEIEGYHNKTINLLSNLDVSRTTGDTRAYRNVGTILNKGWEVTFTSKNIIPKSRDGFRWDTDLNFSHNANRLLKLYNGIQKNMGNTMWAEGYDTQTYYIVRWAGVDPRDGAPLWLDKSGNVTRIYSTANRVPYKTASPKITGGITNTFGYKNLSLRIQMSYVIGGYLFSSFSRNSISDGLYIMQENQSIDQLDRWQSPGDIAANPKPIWGVSTSSVMNSTRYLYHRTSLRLQNVSFSYNLPKKYSELLGLNSCQLQLIGDNLFFYSPYSSKNHNSYKTCMSGYPLERTISFSINIGI